MRNLKECSSEQNRAPVLKKLSQVRSTYFSIRIFDRWVIFLDENSLNKLDSLYKKTRKTQRWENDEIEANVVVQNIAAFLFFRPWEINIQNHFSFHQLLKWNELNNIIITKALLPTPPEPRTTSLYSRILGEKLYFDT